MAEDRLPAWDQIRERVLFSNAILPEEDALISSTVCVRKQPLHVAQVSSDEIVRYIAAVIERMIKRFLQ